MNFYYQLRTKTAKRPTTIYAIISNEGKQYKIATEYKVLPTLWDGTMAIISTYNNAQTNQENLDLNSNLNDFKANFYKNFANFAASNELTFEDIVSNLKTNTMARRRNEDKLTTATALLTQAFNDLCDGKQLKKDSEKKNKQMFDHLKKYVQTNTTDKPSDINQDLTDGYFEVLMKRYASQTINDRMCFLLNLINDVLAVETKYNSYKIKPILKKYRAKDNRGEKERKSCALNEEQVKAIKNVELTPIQNTVRNLFLLDVLIGQRWSDWKEVINTIDLNAKDGFWSYTPTKENKKFVKATIHITDEVKATITTLREDENLNEVLDYSTSKINTNLKEIAKKANLNTPYTYYKSKGNDSEKVTTTIDKVITSHWGRHTFITNKQLEGYSPIEVSKMSGHSDTKMIEKVYSHNEEEIAKRMLLKANERINNAKVVKEESTNQVEEYKKVLAMFNVNPIEWIEQTDQEELFRIVLRHETTFADKLGWSYKQIKDLFNDSTKTLKEKRDILQKALNN